MPFTRPCEKLDLNYLRTAVKRERKIVSQKLSTLAMEFYVQFNVIRLHFQHLVLEQTDIVNSRGTENMI